MTHGSLFSGIGGFDLAAEWMGWENLFNCEWEEFPRKVLKHHFPNAEQYGDIREFNASNYAGRIDILSGGFPCQPYSVAGKRLGKEDERHLWPEMLRIIRECSPRWIVGENVRGLVNWSGGLVFEEVCADLEACGYSVQSFVLPACAVNAPHRRDRVWFVARNTNSRRRRRHWTKREISRQKQGSDPQRVCDSGEQNAPDTQSAGEQGQRIARQGQEEFDRRDSRPIPPNFEHFPTQPPICSGDDGLPRELDGITFPKWRTESIKAYGNAIVPQVALQIFKAIRAYES